MSDILKMLRDYDMTSEEFFKVASNLCDEAADEIERLRGVLVECREEIDAYIWQEYPLDHPLHERYRKRDFSANPARIAIGDQ